MFARTLHQAQQIEEEIRANAVSKTYLAKVHGEFPKCVPLLKSININCDPPLH